MKPEFKVNNFDLLRLLASTQVLVFHSYGHLKLDEPGWLSFFKIFPGVPIFFVISGYLISASYEKSGNLKTYYTNRFLRIYPALWCCIILTVIAYSLLGKVNFLNLQAPFWFITQLAGFIYTPSFLKDFGFGSYNGALWTIPIELQFYIILPILYFILYKLGRKTLFLFIIWGIFIFLAYEINLRYPISSDEEVTSAGTAKLIQYSFVPHYFMFLSGVIFQRLQVFRSRIIFGKGLYWLLAYIAFMYIIPDFELHSILSRLLLTVCVISLAYTRPTISYSLLMGNDISYGVYIYHGIILNLLVEYNKTGNYFSLATMIICTYIIAFISWKFLEKPMIKKKKKTINTVGELSTVIN